METLDYNTLEALNEEWTAFLDKIPWNTSCSISESNRIFASRRNIWMQKMQKKYDVSIQELKAKFIHD